jgi:hypothetical protein
MCAADRHAGNDHGQFSWHHDDDHYILSRTGIDEDVQLTDFHGNPRDGLQRTVSFKTLGQMLLDECLRSVWYRYEDDTLDTLPGYHDTEDRSAYTHHDMHVTAIATLKSIDCYEYQSCEHPEWPESCAKAFCDALRRAITHDIPGYDDAPWGLCREDAETMAVLF